MTERSNENFNSTNGHNAPTYSLGGVPITPGAASATNNQHLLRAAYSSSSSVANPRLPATTPHPATISSENGTIDRMANDTPASSQAQSAYSAASNPYSTTSWGSMPYSQARKHHTDTYKVHLKAYMERQLLKQASTLSTYSSGTAGSTSSTKHSHIFKERQARRLFDQL